MSVRGSVLTPSGQEVHETVAAEGVCQQPQKHSQLPHRLQASSLIHFFSLV